MSFLKTITLVAEILPVLISIIKAVETAIPGKGKGEEKLIAVREILESITGFQTDIWPALLKVITSLVALFNKTGEFKS